jgi:hypothetical protein
MKTNSNQNTKAPPAHTARARSVQASVWETETERGTQYKIIVSRMYRQADGWQRGHTFYAEELAAVVEAVGRIQGWIQHRRRELAGEPNPSQQSLAVRYRTA